MELGNKFPRQADALGRVLEAFELQLVSGWYSSLLLHRSVAEEIDALRDHLCLLKSLGSKVIVFCDTTDSIHGSRNMPLSLRPTLHDSEWAEYGRKLTELGDACLDQGIRIAYHHHMGTMVQSREEIDRLMDNTGESVGLLLDTGHLAYAGGDTLALLDAHGHRIRHVHCKNVRSNVLKDARNRDLSFLDAVMNGVFTVPGDAEGASTSARRFNASSRPGTMAGSSWRPNRILSRRPRNDSRRWLPRICMGSAPNWPSTSRVR